MHACMCARAAPILQARAEELESEFERRQASYMRREEALNQEIEGLQDKLRLLQARTSEARGPAAQQRMDAWRMHACMHAVGWMHAVRCGKA